MLAKPVTSEGATSVDIYLPDDEVYYDYFDFTAVSDAVTVPDNAQLDLGDGPFSYELWFALDETLGTTDQMLLNRGTNAPNVALDGGTRKLMLTKGGFGALFSGSTSIAANGAWHHLVITRSAAGAGNTKIYLERCQRTPALCHREMTAESSQLMALYYVSCIVPRWRRSGGRQRRKEQSRRRVKR